MKKFTLFSLLLVLTMFMLVACGGGGNDVGGNGGNAAVDVPPTPETPAVLPPTQLTTIDVMLVDGAPLVSVVNMMAEDFVGVEGYDINFTITNDMDAIVAALLNQTPDFAIVPVNVAAMMHANGSGYRMAAITTWGIMHIVSDQAVENLEDLIGQTVIGFGRAATPGITLRAVLSQNNIPFVEHDDANFTPHADAVNIIYLTAASDVRDAIATSMVIGGEIASFGLLAEPVATAITGFASNAGRPGVTAQINLQDEWARNHDGEIFPQAALIFHERLLQNDTFFLNEFINLAQLAANAANADPAAAGDLAVSLGSVAVPSGAVLANAFNAGRLPINFTLAPEARTAVDAFLQAIMDENPNLIGGRMPSDEFYYVSDNFYYVR